MGEARRRKLLTIQTEHEEGEGLSAIAAAGWPLFVKGNQEELEAWFTQRKIGFLRPGLHDQPAFLKAEQLNPRALEFMARYVEARSYSELELSEARRKIRIAAEAIAARLARDGRPGKCVTAASSLSRMLDEMGIWNYTAKANVSVQFPPEVGAGTRYFYSVDVGMPEMPHAIVVAPPFTIVDISIKHQAYETRAMGASVPNLVISDVMQPYRPRYTDLVSPEFRARRGLGDDEQKLERHMQQFNASMLEVMTQLPPRQVSFGNGGLIGYAIVAVGGYAEHLRDCVHPNCHLDGLAPPEIFRQDVLPLVGRP
jgi:hypothetical protein